MTLEKIISFCTSQYMIYILSIGWTLHVFSLNRSNKKYKERCDKLQKENVEYERSMENLREQLVHLQEVKDNV
ncbi:MAG: hypothetical protein E7505_04635 [Ruminococcus sp.]|nr:hypothetical protein [Ruminococcus sp.]